MKETEIYGGKTSGRKIFSSGRKGLGAQKRKDNVFYALMMAVPVLQFAIFYIGVNFSSFLLAFQEISVANDSVTWTFGNFGKVLRTLGEVDMLGKMIGMSLAAYAISLFVGVPLGLLFSYYISKRMPLSGAFRVLLFLPSIISAIVLVMIYKNFLNYALPDMFEKWFGADVTAPIRNRDSDFPAIALYTILIGFGTSVLMYSNSMSEIDPEIVDAGKLDGAVGLREFWYITLPQVYPTLSTFLVIGVAGIFTNQMQLFSFYGKTAPSGLQTFGYYLYYNTLNATEYNAQSEYPALAALGLMLTAVAVPLTFLVKRVLEKFGVSED